MAALSVTVSHNDTACTIEHDGAYSPDVLDDLCRRAAAALVATLAQMLAVLEDE